VRIVTSPAAAAAVYRIRGMTDSTSLTMECVEGS